jgi:hypothetical protein
MSKGSRGFPGKELICRERRETVFWIERKKKCFVCFVVFPGFSLGDELYC